MFNDPVIDTVGQQSDNGRRQPLSKFLENIQSQSQFPNALRDFVHPGKDPKELLMRTVFSDMRAVNAAVLLLHKIDEFNMPQKYKDLVQNKLAGQTSLGGLARRELLQGLIGVLSPSLYNPKLGERKGQPLEKERGKEEK